MRRCYPSNTQLVGQSSHRIDSRMDEAARTAEIGFYNDGIAFKGYLSVITLEALSSGTRVSTRSQAPVYQLVHRAIPYWLNGDTHVCPMHFLALEPSLFRPLNIPLRRR
jgi:hypothetical protein